MLVELNHKFKGLDGKEIPESDEMNTVVSNLLCTVRSEKIHSVKAFEWALKLHAKEPLELDQVDFSLLKDFIEKSQLTPLACAQILMKLKEVA